MFAVSTATVKELCIELCYCSDLRIEETSTLSLTPTLSTSDKQLLIYGTRKSNLLATLKLEDLIFSINDENKEIDWEQDLAQILAFHY